MKRRMIEPFGDKEVAEGDDPWDETNYADRKGKDQKQHAKYKYNICVNSIARACPN
jgi:hypothetical protein